MKTDIDLLQKYTTAKQALAAVLTEHRDNPAAIRKGYDAIMEKHKEDWVDKYLRLKVALWPLPEFRLPLSPLAPAVDVYRALGGKALPKPTTQAEYDALPSGTRYIHPVHGERIKQ
jgi:hypothetical protein